MKITVSVFDALCAGGVLTVGACLYLLHPAAAGAFAGCLMLACGVGGPGPWKRWVREE